MAMTASTMGPSISWCAYESRAGDIRAGSTSPNKACGTRSLSWPVTGVRPDRKPGASFYGLGAVQGLADNVGVADVPDLAGVTVTMADVGYTAAIPGTAVGEVRGNLTQIWAEVLASVGPASKSSHSRARDHRSASSERSG